MDNTQLAIKAIEREKYDKFLEKFDEPTTTDDCFTPTNVFAAVVDWCVSEYGIDKERLLRRKKTFLYGRCQGESLQ